MTPVLWDCRGRRFTFPGRALVLGVLNVTPDSFSDGGADNDSAAAIDRGARMAADGADVVDVGGESTRPGSDPVPAAEQLRRVAPVVAGLVNQGVVVSVDTTSAVVARGCLDLGISVINDVTAGRGDPDMAALVAESGAGFIAMHMRGTPKTMQAAPTYADVVADVDAFFAGRLATLAAAGVRLECVALDPGIGFGKRLEHNLSLLKHLPRFLRHGRPVCLGVSRKGFLGTVTGRAVGDRLAGSLAVAAAALAHRSAQIIRTHDVPATRDCVLLDEACHAAD